MSGLSAVYCQPFYHCINAHIIIELDLGLNFHGKMKLSVVLRIKFNQKNKCIYYRIGIKGSE